VTDDPQIWPVTTPFIKTTRLPSPLLIYQLALVPGSLLIGFLLSPLLVLSRHTSQLPAHRLKHADRLKRPAEREIQRRFLAIGFYFFASLIIFGLIGFWTRHCLGGRNPWIWAVFWLTEGSRSWTRSTMLVYWAVLGSFSVGAWSRQLARSRKFQTSNMAMNGGGIPADNLPQSPTPTLTNGFSHVAMDLLDAADKRVPTLSLNARRKSFHALALFMFLPGIVLDVCIHPILHALF
jgi:dolichol kinase